MIRIFLQLMDVRVSIWTKNLDEIPPKRKYLRMSILSSNSKMHETHYFFIAIEQNI